METRMLIRDDGKMFSYNKHLAENPRMSLYTPPAPREEPTQPKKAKEFGEFYSNELHFANRYQLNYFTENKYGITLDLSKDIKDLREDVRKLENS